CRASRRRRRGRGGGNAGEAGVPVEEGTRGVGRVVPPEARAVARGGPRARELTASRPSRAVPGSRAPNSIVEIAHPGDTPIPPEARDETPHTAPRTAAAARDPRRRPRYAGRHTQAGGPRARRACRGGGIRHGLLLV